MSSKVDLATDSPMTSFNRPRVDDSAGVEAVGAWSLPDGRYDHYNCTTDLFQTAWQRARHQVASIILNSPVSTKEQQKDGLNSDHTWTSQENDVFLVDRPEVALDNRMPDSFTNLEVGDFKELQLQSLDPERKFSM